MAAPPAPPNFDGICGTTVKIEHVERVLQKHFNTAHQIVTHEAKSIGDAKGFLSDILRVELTWSRQCQRLPKSIVVKVPCFHKLKAILEMMGGEGTKMATQMMEKLDIVKKASHCESAIYDMITANKVPVKVAGYYGSVVPDNTEGIDPFLLFEDLSSCALPTLHPGLNAGQLRELAKTFADLQAWSIAHEDKWKNDERFNIKFEEVINIDEMVTKGYDDFIKWLDANPDIREKLGGDAVCKHVDILKLPSEIVNSMGKVHATKKFAAYGVPTVLVHGDCWSNNIMYNRLENGEAGDELIALIDWQVCHPGNPLEDFCRVLTFAGDPNVRRNDWPSIFDVYYERLKENLKSYGHELKPTRDQMWEVYEYTLSLWSSFMVTGLCKFYNIPKGTLANYDPEVHGPMLLEKTRALLEDNIKFHEVHNLDILCNQVERL